MEALAEALAAEALAEEALEEAALEEGDGAEGGGPAGKEANAGGPMPGAHPTIVQTGAHLGDNKVSKAAASV